MNTPQKPALRPNNPRFSSGPCTKRPGWTPDALKHALLGRNHRQPETKARLELAIARTRALLGLPDGYRLAIVPASDTGAVEMALWSLLGPRGVDVLAWEAFSRDWVTDITEQLKLTDVRPLLAAYGELPDLSQVDFSRDVVFAWNGTTSGVRVPSGDFIAADRKGLTICDATSAVFAQEIDWTKLDAATFSWQKVLGGEAQHGMLILGPRAVERLESHTPAWPLPKLFRMTRGGKLNAELFAGSTINTPSMLCVQDYLDALDWVDRVGGLAGTIARSNANASVIAEWVARTPWVDFLARVPADAIEHIHLPQDRRPRGDGAAARAARGAAPPDGGAARSRECRQGHRCLSLCPAGLAHLDRRHRGKERRRKAAAVARLGLRGGETGARQGGLTKRHRVLASAPAQAL